MPPRSEQYPLHRKRDEEDDSSSGGRDARNNRRDARDAKRNGEVIPVMQEMLLKMLPVGSVSETSETFDPAAYFETAKKAYAELGRRVQKIGIQPNEIAEAWESADATLDEIKKYSKEYTAETNPGKKEEIVMLMQRLGASLSGGGVSSQIEDAARELRNEKREKESPEVKAREAFGALVSDTLHRIPEAATQQPVAPVAEAEPVVAGETDLAESSIPDELAQIYGDKIPPPGVLKLFRMLTSEKNKRDYLDYVRAREEANRRETAVISSAAVLEAEEQSQIDQNIEARRTATEPSLQVETKPGLAWTEPKEEAQPGRERALQAPVDTRPLIQVETKVETAEAKEPEPAAWADPMWGDEPPLENAWTVYSTGKSFNVNTEGTHKEWREALRTLIESKGAELNTPAEAAAVSAAEETSAPVLEPEESATSSIEAVSPEEAKEMPLTPDSFDLLRENQFGIKVPPTEAHLYEIKGQGLFMYGGTPEEQEKMIREYLSKNPLSVIYAEDAEKRRVPWLHGLEEKRGITQGLPVRTKGFFASFVKAPTPDEFQNRIL